MASHPSNLGLEATLDCKPAAPVAVEVLLPTTGVALACTTIKEVSTVCTPFGRVVVSRAMLVDSIAETGKKPPEVGKGPFGWPGTLSVTTAPPTVLTTVTPTAFVVVMRAPGGRLTTVGTPAASEVVITVPLARLMTVGTPAALVVVIIRPVVLLGKLETETGAGAREDGQGND